MTPAEAVLAKIESLSPPDQLRLAALLLEERKPEMAKSVIDRVSAELAIVLGTKRTT